MPLNARPIPNLLQDNFTSACSAFHSGTGLNTFDIDTLRQELKALAERNLDEATFDEKREVISKLDIKIYPLEDLKTMRIKCGVNLTCEDIDNGNGAVHCGKIIFVPPRVTIGETTRVSWDEGF